MPYLSLGDHHTVHVGLCFTVTGAAHCSLILKALCCYVLLRSSGLLDEVWCPALLSPAQKCQVLEQSQAAKQMRSIILRICVRLLQGAMPAGSSKSVRVASHQSMTHCDPFSKTYANLLLGFTHAKVL